VDLSVSTRNNLGRVANENLVKETELILSLGAKITDALDAAHAVSTSDRFRQYCDFGYSQMYPKLQETSLWCVGGYKKDVQ
jgi:hypothetical protein